MELLCNEGVLNLDEFNDYKPDGKDIYCRFDIAMTSGHHIPENDYGTFIKTTDDSVIYFSDIVFKMLFDLSVKAQLESTKFIKNEVHRANKRDEETDLFILSRPNNKKALGQLLSQNNIKNVLLPDDSCIVKGNLKALSEHDVINMMCANAKYYNPEYAKNCFVIVQFLNDYIHLGKGVKSFIYLHKALTELFCTFSVDEFKNFIKNFYLHLDNIPEMKYNENKAGTLDVNTSITSAGTDEENTEVSARINESENGNTKNTSKKQHENSDIQDARRNEVQFKSRKLKTLSGADITGFDETYSANYCEAFYNNEIENADSEGFLEKLIIARANETAAPIDLLSEAITREHSKDTATNKLRKNIEEIKESIQEALQEEAYDSDESDDSAYEEDTSSDDEDYNDSVYEEDIPDDEVAD